MRSTIVIKGTLSRRRFSLVDVVVIASLIGIIASFSVPRFTRLANRARAAQVIALREESARRRKVGARSVRRIGCNAREREHWREYH